MWLVNAFLTLIKKTNTSNSHAEENFHLEIPTYNSSLIAKVVVEKNKVLSDKLKSEEIVSLDFILLRPLLMFAFIEKYSLKVLDLGGGGGTHYHVTRNFLDKDLNLEWAVVETPHMVAAAQNIFDKELSFFPSIDKAIGALGEADVALASGVFEYLEDPILGLRELMTSNANFMLITRTSLTANNSTLRTIQASRLKDNGPGPLSDEYDDVEIRYPITVVNKDLFTKTICEKYKIVCEIIEDKFVHNIDGNVIHQYGFLCKLK